MFLFAFTVSQCSWPNIIPKSAIVDGVLCGICREARQRLGLLENDTHWDHTNEDAVILSNAKQIRKLFSTILSTCFPSTPIDLWNKYKDHMAEDTNYDKRKETERHLPGYYS